MKELPVCSVFYASYQNIFQSLCRHSLRSSTRRIQWLEMVVWLSSWRRGPWRTGGSCRCLDMMRFFPTSLPSFVHDAFSCKTFANAHPCCIFLSIHLFFLHCCIWFPTSWAAELDLGAEHGGGLHAILWATEGGASSWTANNGVLCEALAAAPPLKMDDARDSSCVLGLECGVVPGKEEAGSTRAGGMMPNIFLQAPHLPKKQKKSYY